MKFSVNIIQLEANPYLHFAVGDSNLAAMQTFEAEVTVSAVATAVVNDGQQRGPTPYVGS
jgi:hypothetical protein